MIPRSYKTAHNHFARLLAVGIACFSILSGSGTLLSAAELRLTTDSRLKRDPVFIKGGEELVYVVLDRPEQLRLMRMSMADRTVAPLHPTVVGSEMEPAFSPDGRYYAYLQSRSPASVALMIRDTREKKDAEIPPAPGFSGMRSPTFTPDNGRVLFSFGEDGRQQIFSVDLQAADRKTIIDSTGINNWPTITPDGQQIVFASTRDGNFDIYAHAISGGPVRRLTDSPAQDIRPRLSPDGKRIAFTSNRDGNYEIYVMQTDGSQLTRVTDNAERDDYPSWHPDGKRLVTVSERSGRFDLYLIDLP